jgi:biotin carboxylase
VRNKLLMKDAVSGAGLRVPAFLPLQTFLDDHRAARWKGRTVLKPHSGASSVDISVFDTPEQAVHGIRQQIHSGQLLNPLDYQVEAFIQGPIHHYDGLVKNGQILALTASQYIGTCLAYMDRAQPLGSYQLKTTGPMYAWVSQVLSAVALREGSFHLEAIIDNGQPVFLEIGNRVGGADVVPTFELATGLHLPSLELRIHLGEPDDVPFAPALASASSFGWFVFPGHGHANALYGGLNGARPFRDSPNVIQWHELPDGARLPGHITYSAHEAPLTGIIETASPALTRQWIESLFKAVSLRTPALADDRPPSVESVHCAAPSLPVTTPFARPNSPVA